MSLYVVDASAAIKWILPEPGSADALRLQDPAHELHAPAFLDLEIANVLWKSVRLNRITRQEGDARLADVPAWPVSRHHEAPLLARALDLANDTGRSVYDCLYLALASELGGQMVTADEKLVNSLAATPQASFILLLRDVP
jgi:predicted nucleic acid-binding protein